MFQKGDRVTCINDQMDAIPCLAIKKGGLYTVKTHLSLKEYEKQNPDSSFWLKDETREKWKDGAVCLEEVLGADESDLIWNASRFKPAE